MKYEDMSNPAPEPAWVKAVEAYSRLGSYGTAAAELGVSKGTVFNHVKRHRLDMLRNGRVPDGYEVKSVKTRVDKNEEITGQSVEVVRAGSLEPHVHMPDPKTLARLSTNMRGDGSVIQQWAIEKPELAKQREAWKGYAVELLRPIEPATLLEPLPPRLVPPEQRCALYPIGDYHVGMMAAGLETRSDNWDIKVAEQMLARAAEELMRGAPPSEQAVLAFMGDFVHFDSLKPVTPASGHQLDADTRFWKVARTAIRIVRHIIAAARRYHDRVHVIFLDGNHDPAVATLINAFLIEFYADDENVTVDASPSNRRYYEYGQNLLGFTHGDRTKADKMPILMAAEMREAWGRTKHRLVLTGHLHHESRKDHYGAAVEVVPVLIPNDAWGSAAGYNAARAMQVIVLDREFGEDQRHTFNAERFYRSI